jgi:hypothetical protein
LEPVLISLRASPSGSGFEKRESFMKSSSIGGLLVVFVAFTGCNLGTRGGPGASDPNASKPLFYGQSDDTFNLSVPGSTAIKQGETREASIGIERGTNFDEDVALKFSSMPMGVTMDPPSPVIKRSEKTTQVVLKAAHDASLGDFTIEVTGHPTRGVDASNELNITVAKR